MTIPATGVPQQVFGTSVAGLGTVSLSLPKDPALIAAVRLTVAGVALQAGLNFETCEDLEISRVEIAHRVGVSQMQISRLQQRAIGKIRVALQEG